MRVNAKEAVLAIIFIILCSYTIYLQNQLHSIAIQQKQAIYQRIDSSFSQTQRSYTEITKEITYLEAKMDTIKIEINETKQRASDAKQASERSLRAYYSLVDIVGERPDF